MTGKCEVLKKGALVKFRAKVFRAPYAPHYDAYRGETFRLVAHHYSKTHLQLTCVSDRGLRLQGYVHLDEVYALRGAQVSARNPAGAQRPKKAKTRDVSRSPRHR